MARRRSSDSDNDATTKTQGVKPHRDVDAASRVIKALDAAIAGHDWQTVADLSGYASKGAAYNAVQRELDRIISKDVETLRTLQHARMMRLVSVYYPKAMGGDGWSADRVVRFDERDAQLMGLDTPKADANAAQTNVRRIYERR